MIYYKAQRARDPGSRGKIFHTRDHKSEIPLENATEHPLDSSSTRSTGQMTILWKIPLTSEIPLENASDNPRCLLRCRFFRRAVCRPQAGKPAAQPETPLRTYLRLAAAAASLPADRILYIYVHTVCTYIYIYTYLYTSLSLYVYIYIYIYM